MDLESLGTSQEDLIAQFVILLRQKGTLLPYDDYQVIKSWSAIGLSDEKLFLVLNDELPSFFEKQKEKSKNPPPLSFVAQRIIRKLKEYKNIL